MWGPWFSILWTALKLGVTSFGGPTAHIGYFREEYVNRKRWLTDSHFADLVALCQFLPGPASSQLGMSIGWLRGGTPGAIAAWIGFTLPSALILAVFALLYPVLPATDTGWIRGLELAAIAIVAQALLGMSRSLAPDRARATIAVLAAATVLLLPLMWVQVGVILAAAAAGVAIVRASQRATAGDATTPATPKAAAAPSSAYSASSAAPKRSLASFYLGLFTLLLIALPILGTYFQAPLLSLTESFYRAGSFVFGGGHVVLPLLEKEVVPNGLVSEELFLAGYAATQAMPGPLFTFAAFLGAAANGWGGALLATVAIFLPGFLLVLGVLPYWQRLRQIRSVQSALYGINAAVVGILLAALYDPLFTSAVRSIGDFVLVAVLFLLFVQWRVPPWLLVILAAISGALLL